MYRIDTDDPMGPATPPRWTRGGARETAPSPADTPSSDVAARNVAWVVGAARRQKAWIVAPALIGLVLAAGSSLLLSKQFVAGTQLLIDPRDLRVLQNDVSPQGTYADAMLAHLESQTRVIQSDAVLRRAVEREALDFDPEFGGERPSLFRDKVLRPLGLGGAREAVDPSDKAVWELTSRVDVRRREKTFVIDVWVTTEDPRKSARIANAVAAAYLEDQTEVRGDAARRANAALGGRLSELRERVRLAEEKIEAYKARNAIVGAGGKLVNDELLAQATAQLSLARGRVSDAKAKLDETQAVRAVNIESGALPEAVQSNTVSSLRAQLGAALGREADLRTLLGPRHPDFVSAQVQVRDARRQVQEELARITQAARVEYDRARSAEAAVLARLDGLKRETLSTGQALVQLRELERELETHRSVYQAFLLRARETGEQAGVDTTNARVITPASPPQSSIGPNRKLIAAAGLFLGLALGLALAVGREWLGARSWEARTRVPDRVTQTVATLSPQARRA